MDKKRKNKMKYGIAMFLFLFCIALLTADVSLSLTSPANNSLITSVPITFTGTVTQTNTILLNTSLLINDTVIDTNTSNVSGTYTFSSTPADGSHSWIYKSWFKNFNQSTVFDLKGLNNGTVTGAVINNTYARIGDGGAGFTDDYIEIADDDSLDFETGNFTITAWIYPEEFYNHGSVYNVFFGKGQISTNTAQYFALAMDSGQRIIWTMENTSVNVQSGTGFLNNWYHIAAQRHSNGTLYLYINGSLVGTSTIATTLNFTNTEIFYLGRDKSSGRTFNGSLDDVMIFNRSLNSTEVLEIYNNNSNGDRAFTDDASLVSYYTFDETTLTSNETTPYYFTLDTTIPSVEFISPTPADGARTTNTSVTINVSVTEVNLYNITFYLYDQAGLEDEATYTNGTTSHTFTGLTNQRYTYKVTVYDSANNTITSNTRVLIIGNEAGYISPLNIKYIFVNIFAGNQQIFMGLFFIALVVTAGMFRMPDKVFLVLFALAGIMLYGWIGAGIYFLVILIAGLATFWTISRIVKT